MEENKGGSFGALVDFSFSRFVTLKLIKVIYFLVFIIAAIVSVVIVVAAFMEDTNWGIGALLLSPVLFLINILIARVYMELVVVLFRIEENTRKS
jgi:hypothetical protein